MASYNYVRILFTYVQTLGLRMVGEGRRVRVRFGGILSREWNQSIIL